MAYMAVFLVAVTWPGAMLFNSVEPLVLGLPFNLFLIALLILGALCLLACLYICEKSADTD